MDFLLYFVDCCTVSSVPLHSLFLQTGYQLFMFLFTENMLFNLWNLLLAATFGQTGLPSEILQLNLELLFLRFRFHYFLLFFSHFDPIHQLINSLSLSWHTERPHLHEGVNISKYFICEVLRGKMVDFFYCWLLFEVILKLVWIVVFLSALRRG